MMQFFSYNSSAVAPKPDETLIEYWMSFSPVAPMVGLSYRPAEILTFNMDVLGEAPAPAEDEVLVEAVEEAPEPVAEEAAPAVEAPAEAEPEAPVESDLTLIKGIGPKLQAELNGLGLITVAQLAEYNAEQVAELSEAMTSFKDRPVRNDWVGQAKALVA
ncbi:MAG: hypothetical protein AAGJ96_08375 [Pseudomonadota bacterium]